MRKFGKKVAILFMAILMSLFVISCGEAETEYEPEDYVSMEGKNAVGAGFVAEDEVSMDGDEDEVESVDAPNIISEEDEKNYGEKLVYTCSMEFETTKYADTIKGVKKLIKKYNGLIESESEYDNVGDGYYGDFLSTNITIRIPTKNYEKFVQKVGDLGKVISKDAHVENITKRYNDTATTIKSLETQETRLLAMMENANSIKDMLAIEDRLTEVQNELKICQNSLSEMDTDVAYSTIDLSVREVVEYADSDDPVKTGTFMDRMKNALKTSGEYLATFFEWILTFIIEIGPILLVIGGFSFLVVFVVLKIVKSNREKNKTKKNNEN